MIEAFVIAACVALFVPAIIFGHWLGSTIFWALADWRVDRSWRGSKPPDDTALRHVEAVLKEAYRVA